MPRHACLFGKYLRLNGSVQRKGFKKNRILHPVPVKAYGRVPSASSQTGLYHDEDYNYYSKVAFSLQRTRIKLKPNVFKKDFESELLNVTVPNVRVTTSALHAMTKEGGFDKYILNTSPEHLRSQLGERMRKVAYFYKRFPEIREMQLPWKVFYGERNRSDPIFAIYKHLMAKQRSEDQAEREQKRYSPFYLPPMHGIIPERQPFKQQQSDTSDAVAPGMKLDLWWRRGALEPGFRQQLARARPFDAAHVDVDMLNAYRKGGAAGGGGPQGKAVRRRSKTFHFGYNKHL